MMRLSTWISSGLPLANIGSARADSFAVRCSSYLANSEWPVVVSKLQPPPRPKAGALLSTKPVRSAKTKSSFGVCFSIFSSYRAFIALAEDLEEQLGAELVPAAKGEREHWARIFDLLRSNREPITIRPSMQ
jgi:hypothetical protein